MTTNQDPRVLPYVVLALPYGEFVNAVPESFWMDLKHTVNVASKALSLVDGRDLNSSQYLFGITTRSPSALSSL